MQNCSSFAIQLDKMMKKGYENIGLLMLDLDRFQYVSEVAGHATGKMVLEHVAERLVQAAPIEGIWGNYWGTNFFWRYRRFKAKISCDA